MHTYSTNVAERPQAATRDGRSRKARQKHRLGWMKFEGQFRERHPRFLQELARGYPTLSGTELEICAMLLEALPSWQIADVLGIAERSVENHRSNIRKKFNLHSHQTLHTFLLGVMGSTTELVSTKS
jgi:DNA-binding CsgD family transcriptional regulator